MFKRHPLYLCMLASASALFVMLRALPSTLPSIVFDLNSLGSTCSFLLFFILSFQVATRTLLLIPLLIASLALYLCMLTSVHAFELPCLNFQRLQPGFTSKIGEVSFRAMLFLGDAPLGRCFSLGEAPLGRRLSALPQRGNDSSGQPVDFSSLGPLRGPTTR